MSAPSVGRIVHYRSRGSADGRFKPECRAAIVTNVSATPDVVDLAVLNPTGLFFDRYVPLGEDEQVGGTWHWPERVE